MPDPGWVYFRAHPRKEVPDLRQLPRGVRSRHHHAPAILRGQTRAGSLSHSPRESVLCLSGNSRGGNERRGFLPDAVTTATLELGIDIGRLERAFQIDAPFTVSSFLQRMGRTGRRDLPPEMWFVMREEPPEPRALLPTTIPWKLLQGIALVQVYLEEHWVEPPRLDRLPYSLLYHQTMCTLASCGELTPAALASRVLTLSYFHRVSQEDFKLLLRHLLKIDHIERTETGGLIVGIAGERLTSPTSSTPSFRKTRSTLSAGTRRNWAPLYSPRRLGKRSPLPVTSGWWKKWITSGTRCTANRSRGKFPPISANAPAIFTRRCWNACGWYCRNRNPIPI